MSFHAPYRLRLMLLINGQPEELVRFNRHVYNSDIAFFTRGLTCPWWKERPLQERECVSSRPRPVPAGREDKLPLRSHERARLKDYA